MSNDNEEHGRTGRSVHTATVSRPIIPAENQAPTRETAARTPERLLPSAGIADRRRILILVTTAALAVAIVVAMLTLVGGMPGRTQGRAGPTVAPTATATSTPTATVMPTPTAMPGFQVYLDRAQGILLQYPASWTVTPTHPGTQFQNDPKNATFEAELGLPDPDALSRQSSDAANAGAWVDYELSSLTTLYGEQFQRVAGPTPAVTFGGIQWQTGIGYLGDGQSRVRVKVYATVYNGRPVIINLLAADSAFGFAEEDYFGPMLQSFTFLTPKA